MSGVNYYNTYKDYSNDTTCEAETMNERELTIEKGAKGQRSPGVENSMHKVAKGAKNLDYSTHGRKPVSSEYHG